MNLLNDGRRDPFEKKLMYLLEIVDKNSADSLIEQ
jgi:hypothetical protein